VFLYYYIFYDYQKYHYLLLYLCSLHTCDRFLCILKKLISYLTPEYISEFSSSGLLIVKSECMGSSVHLHYVEGVQSILNVNHILSRHEESRRYFVLQIWTRNSITSQPLTQPVVQIHLNVYSFESCISEFSV